MTIDWTKPIETVTGKRATLINIGEYSVHVEIEAGARLDGKNLDKASSWGWNMDGTIGTEWLPNLRNVPESVAQPVNATTLYREIDALGGYFDTGEERALGRAEQLDTVLAILAKRGFTEQADATPPMYDDAMALIHEMARVSHTSTDIDHYDEAKRIHDAVTPVDPDLLEARKIAISNIERTDATDRPRLIGKVLAGEVDDCAGYGVWIALAAIKRGRELATKP